MAGWALLVAAASFWAGILVAGVLHPAPRTGTAWAILGAGPVLLLGSAAAGAARRPLLGPVCLVLAFLVLGWGWSSLRTARTLGSPLAELSGRSVTISGALLSPPRPHSTGWSASLRVDAVHLGPRSRSALLVAEPLWVGGRGRPPRLERGDRVAATGVIRRAEGDFGRFLQLRGFPATLSVREISSRGPPRNPLLRAANITRVALGSALHRVLPAREAGLVMGLALGDTSGMDREVEERFRATGLSHLTAVSGANVAMFLAPILGAIGLVGGERRARLAVGLLALAFFVMLTGAEPSVLRASVMAGVTLLGLFLGRPRTTRGAMGAAVLALLALNHSLVHSVAFQLSVAATAGMVFAAAPVAERLRALPRVAALATASTISAQAAVTPLLLYHFGVVPTVALPANLLAAPAVSPAMLLGVATGGVELAWHGGAAVLAALARVPLSYLLAVASHLSRSPLPSITSSPGRVAVLAVGLAAVAMGAWWLRSRRRLPRAALAAGLVLLLPLFLWSGGIRAGPPSRLTATFFDVGQGDAALVRSAGGASLLIDGGPERYDVARKLASLGVRRLDVLMASHSHEDHVAGLPAVLARFPVALVLEPGCDDDAPPYREFLHAVRASGVRVHHPRQGAVVVVGDLRLEILGPDRCYVGTSSDPNNGSLVVRITDGRGSVLFTGDAEEVAQADILQDLPGRLPAWLLKVPHHGGDTSLEEFLAATRARVAVVSSGEGNRYGHPKPELLAKLERAGMRVLRTDRSGDLTLTFDEGAVHVESGGG